MEKAKLQNWNYLVLSFSIYVLLLFAFGFAMDSIDMIEVIPTIKKIWDPSLYAKDFYLNYVQQQNITERTVFNKLLSLIVDSNFYILYLFHFFVSISLIIAVLKICSLYIKNLSLQFLATIIVLLVLSYTSIGDNEWYANCFISSYVSSLFILWSIYFWLKEKLFPAYVFLIVACYIHIGYGIQWILIYSIFAISNSIFYKDWKRQIGNLFILLIFSLPYIIYIVFATQGPHGHGLDTFYTIEFRLGHHFLIQYAKNWSIAIYVILLVCGLSIWNTVNKKISYLYILQAAGMLVYLLGTYFFQTELILKTQWLRTSMWIELFSVIACLMWIEKRIHVLNYFYNISIGLYVFLILFFAIRKNPWQHEIDIVEERQIAEYCKLNTPIDALFVTPSSFTLFKTISERSSWVDYKAISHSPAYFIAWYDRINKLYQISLKDRRMKLDLQKLADNNLCALQESTLTYLINEQNVDYLILPFCYSEDAAYLKKIYSTTHYNLFQRK